MKEQNTETRTESRPEWETLESFARERIQHWLQKLLEEEVTDLLGREKSVRRSLIDAPAGYRNGYGKLRRVTLSSGTERDGERAAATRAGSGRAFRESSAAPVQAADRGSGPLIAGVVLAWVG